MLLSLTRFRMYIPVIITTVQLTSKFTTHVVFSCVLFDLIRDTIVNTR